MAHFDPAFRDAVTAGHLSAAQAYARGKRDAYIARLRKRHELSAEDAARVADNRVQLAELILPEPELVDDAPDSRGPMYAIVGVLAVLTAVVVWYMPNRDSLLDPRGKARVSEGMLLDEAGRVVRVIADSPERVLQNYCTAGDRRRCRPLGLMPTAGAEVAVRIGVFRRSSGDTSDVSALAIRHDSISNRWYAGDGTRPLAGSPAPSGADKVAASR